MDSRTGWAVLFAATGFELVSTVYMDAAKGFSKPRESVIAAAAPVTRSPRPRLRRVLAPALEPMSPLGPAQCIFYAASFYGFNLSLRALDTSVAYAVWSAVVMAALSAVGVAFLGESANPTKFVGIGSIIFGTILLSTQISE